LILPGIGTAHDLKRAYEIGVRSVRVATHCTEADVSAQHIATARELGMDVSGFLMMSQLNTPEGLAQQAKMMESDGANCVYVVDSGGRLTMDGIKARVRAYRDVIDPSTEIGVHAQRTSRSQWPTAWQPSKRASPAWTPRSPGWVPAPATAPSNRSFVAVADLTGWEHSADLFALQDAADDLVRPLMDRPVRVDRETLTLGYAGSTPASCGTPRPLQRPTASTYAGSSPRSAPASSSVARKTRSSTSRSTCRRPQTMPDIVEPLDPRAAASFEKACELATAYLRCLVCLCQHFASSSWVAPSDSLVSRPPSGPAPQPAAPRHLQ
jgi:hypothetical protein